MSRPTICLAAVLGFAAVSPVEAQGLVETLNVISIQGVGRLSPLQLIELGEFQSPAGARRDPRLTAEALVKDVFFGQILWWWAAERSISVDTAVSELLAAWRERYDQPPPKELEAGLRDFLVGIPPTRTRAGTVYQPPSYVATGPIIQVAFPFQPGWPGLDPQVKSGISRISIRPLPTP